MHGWVHLCVQYTHGYSSKQEAVHVKLKTSSLFAPESEKVPTKLEWKCHRRQIIAQRSKRFPTGFLSATHTHKHNYIPLLQWQTCGLTFLSTVSNVIKRKVPKAKVARVAFASTHSRLDARSQVPTGWISARIIKVYLCVCPAWSAALDISLTRERMSIHLNPWTHRAPGLIRGIPDLQVSERAVQ